ncbi:hypothetical protein [Henriciella aquimarina]|uniref:hypothetical protein n=1 Tax=Henriciella aquimarina TaxID=545261 RepID=UPI000A026F00|nr:hypothetical protein [Henriciella aquimarina]
MMRFDRQIPGLVLAAVLVAACGAPDPTATEGRQVAPEVSADELAVLSGDDWEGELTYLKDADEGAEVTLPVELAVAQNGQTFELYFSYPEQPTADGRAEVIVSDDGKMLNDETIVSREQKDDGFVLITQQACKDNDLEAQCEYTYWISEHAFSIRKMVRIDGREGAFQRTYYSFTR